MFSKKSHATELTAVRPTQPGPGQRDLPVHNGHDTARQLGGATLAQSECHSDGIVIVGRGTRITGEITDCLRLEIQGVVEGTIVADALVIRAGGSVTGRLQANHAEVHGYFNGQLQITDLLDVRSTGRVEGELAYGKLAVAMGGHISGNITTPDAATLLEVVEQLPSDQPAATASPPTVIPNYDSRYGAAQTN